MNDGWIVVVDDNPNDLRLVRVLLAAAGYQVHTAPDTEAADRLLTVFPARLMLIDFQRSASRRSEYVRRLKAAPETRHTFVIAMIAGAAGSTQRGARDAGCDHCIAKPIDSVTLLETVARRWVKRNPQS